MSFINWEKNYSINNDEIDGQHKKLLELINVLDACSGFPETDKVSLYRNALDKLMDYVNYHFSAEEQLMQNSSYPEYLFHRKAHATFLKKVMHFVNSDLADDQLVTRPLDEKYRELLVFLKNWLIMHILIADKKFGDYLNR